MRIISLDDRRDSLLAMFGGLRAATQQQFVLLCVLIFCCGADTPRLRLGQLQHYFAEVFSFEKQTVRIRGLFQW